MVSTREGTRGCRSLISVCGVDRWELREVVGGISDMRSVSEGSTRNVSRCCNGGVSETYTIDSADESQEGILIDEEILS